MLGQNPLTVTLLAIIAITAATSFISHPRHILLPRFNSFQSIESNRACILPQPTESDCFHTIICPDNKSNDWHRYCHDIDEVLEGLISPAPESFDVLHSVMCNINSMGFYNDKNSGVYMNDLVALSSFLVKPKYAIQLYWYMNVIGWKLVPRNGHAGVIYPSGLSLNQENDKMYHRYNVLELSKMALGVATEDSLGKRQSLARIHEFAREAWKRLLLTKGTDLRGFTSSEACFNFALAGVQHMESLFKSLCCVGTHELKRIGFRTSCKSKHILHMVEKFAASGIEGEFVSELFHLAGVCLETKGHNDISLIGQLKRNDFGFGSQRSLVWLWRFSSRQTKLTPRCSNEETFLDWNEIFHDTSKPLVVDLGSGMGSSLLNLATLNITNDAMTCLFDKDGTLQMPWLGFNYAGAELNQAMVNFGNAIITRGTFSQRKGRVHFFCMPAQEFLDQLKRYPGRIALVMINFPSPYRFVAGNAGNSQLPSMQSGRFMVTRQVLQSISALLSKSDGNGFFLFQTKCEDIVVHVKNECLGFAGMEPVPCKHSVRHIDCQYIMRGQRPKRLDDWLQMNPSVERAQGIIYSSTSLLPPKGLPETEAQCILDGTVVHRIIFRVVQK